MKAFMISVVLIFFASVSYGKVKNFEHWVFAEKSKEYTEIFNGFCGDFGDGGSCKLQRVSVNISDCSLSFNEVLGDSSDSKYVGDTWIATAKGLTECDATTVYELSKSGLRFKRFYPKKKKDEKDCPKFNNFETTYKYYKDYKSVGSIPLGNCKALDL